MKRTSKTNGGRRELTRKPASTVGPVRDLEAFLQPDWWKRIFNSMYLRTDADVVEDETVTSFELDLFSGILDLHHDQVILDLACGQGRHTLGLSRRGFRNVYGLDRSHYLIQKAKQAGVQEGLKAKFREGDARKLPYQADFFDVVMILGNSFGYFESVEDDRKILLEILRVLRPGGKFLLDVADGSYLRENFQPRSWEWLDKNYFVCRERSLASDNERLISREMISHATRGVVTDQFYAERLYTGEMLSDLLRKAGFKDIEVHDDYHTSSSRNQDLGMMERRIILSATVIKEWSPRKANALDLNHVVVILGDPDKSDIIKPNTVFDEDDFTTIDHLKSALSSLQGYRFTYLNDHDTLIQNLLKIRARTDLVLNLCDEGLYNEAVKELHIPAVLEALRIPYSGSNPQCLAYCYDKSLIRGVAKEMGIPVAEAFYVRPGDNIFELNIGFPVIAKPNFGDSSFGITRNSVAHNVEELNDAILQTRDAFGYDHPLLVEEFLTGKDLSVGIIGNPPDSYMVLPIIEEDYSQLPDGLPKICGYEAKWIQDSPYFQMLRSIRAELDEFTEKQIIAWCLELMTRLDCKDYVRFDWRLDREGIPRLLEVNPNPGWCWDGHLAKMASLAGLDYPAMLGEIITESRRRTENMRGDLMANERSRLQPPEQVQEKHSYEQSPSN